MQKMLERYMVQNVETFNMDALTFPYYDDVKYILLDPSCSGSGKYDLFVIITSTFLFQLMFL